MKSQRTKSRTTAMQSITTLPDSPELDRAHRLSKYVWQMAFRVVCFVGAVLIWSAWHTWLAVIPIVAAAVIPWVAVILANAGSQAESDIVTPAGAIELYDAVDPRLREQQEDARAEAYRAEQERLREQAQHAQEEWQRNGDRSRVWTARSKARR
ncbi:DUF3099 domain-containing protein [Curtobacterium sp. Csp1]|uniref:DUF3099 domain-containing protein n=1 Tax=Curtobacterium citreum TaxID=2036 RepID=A0ABT2HDC8_9MICO|nr:MULTISPECIES: DUF3099 domain-containing protein [Curtobacterium]MCS6521274.1 DUF3099 domain-containing protein [Curtobacterium citreum]QKS14431.1 DUF3099 domain-containing protein [Curtobacterium sp. csp3]QKS18570.1 DUF3099 domain-containing protein [Curtobacterium sp. Csp1]RDH99203.1 DUF3099 family protein [Curtobacterium sp. AG1037]TQJ28130.1 DUF3099 family protein [Curtobacterium citreum]